MRFNPYKLGLAGALAAVLSCSAVAGEVEVLHWWTSGGEAKSVAELKRMLEARGHTWQDMAVAGGGGESAMTVLKSRVVSGDPPTAAQIKGPAIQEWGDEGVLADLDPVATGENWDAVLPPVVSRVMKYDDHYVAAPVNVHRVNWLWANPEVLARAGVEVPKTWEEFATVAQKIQDAGFIPVAHGGQPWQDATVFETIVLARGGADFYRKAFVDLDPEALNSPTMVEAFQTLNTYKQFVDQGAPGRDWNLATAMVINGEAAMQIMGDWAKGEFAAAGLTPGEDYICAPAPGTQDQFIFNIDSFVMFAVGGGDTEEAQQALASTIMSPEFQEVFNLNKGSIPARTDMSMEPFDACAKDSAQTFVASSEANTLVPSLAHGMAATAAVQGAITDVVTQFFNSDMAPEAAAEQLVQAVRSASL